MVEMEIVEVEADFHTDVRVIILQEKDGGRFFRIFVGRFEYEFLIGAIKRQEFPRPMTHDLVLSVIGHFGSSLVGIVVDSLEHEAFHGKLMVKMSHGQVERIDCRPSDALVLAMKNRVPIYVEEEVLNAAGADDPGNG